MFLCFAQFADENKVDFGNIKEAVRTQLMNAQPKFITQLPEFSKKCRLNSTFILTKIKQCKGLRQISL
jgi:hypothetical protein